MTAPFRTAIALEAERAVLGSCLLDPTCIAGLTDFDPADFAGPGLGAVARAIVTLAGRGAPVDTVSVVAEMRPPNAGPVAAMVSGLMSSVASAQNAGHHLALVREAATRRRLSAAGAAISAAAQDAETAQEAVEASERALAAVGRSGGGAGPRHLGGIVGEAFRRIEVRADNRRAVTGVPTGLLELDELTAGLQPTDLVIVAGRPSMGKTAAAVGWGVHAALSGVPTLVFSLEMSAGQLAERMLASEGRMDGHRLRIGSLDPEDWPRLAGACRVLSEAPLWVDDQAAISLADVRARSRRLAAEHGIGLIVIDYLQLMRGAGAKSQNREQEIAETSRGLKALAKELNIPVVALSQLNRGLEGRGDKRPLLSDLRESGAIEQDADVVMALYRDEVYNRESPDKGLAEVLVLKQRNGSIGVVHCAFLARSVRFENLLDGGARSADDY